MSDSIPQTTPAPSELDPVKVFFALGSEARWPVMKALADGRFLTIAQAAKLLDRDPDAVSRQLHVLDRAGIAKRYAAEDRRITVYQIPAAYRRELGVLDFGFCRIDLRPRQAATLSD